MLDCCVCCSVTGQGLNFMTVDDVVTVPGYPRHVMTASHHVQTRIVFYYKRNCELCRTVRRWRSRRRRRQTDIDDTQIVLTNDLVDDVLDFQA